ncbi:MAG TPA: protein-S-isoprenylcysteine O-methyltransferase [Chthoniobacterales bacterium]|nr:protein-S-isoprenylcysteine O-methyltransferase [Chthoniobacterales bacterium]
MCALFVASPGSVMRNLSHLAFLVGFCVYVGIRAFYKQRTKSNQVEIGRMDFIEKALLVLLIPGALLFPLVYLFTSWLAFADYRLPANADAGGLLLMMAALYLFWRSHADLGENWSQTLELRKGHELVTHGVYRSIRHPMYASLWLWFVAQSLVLQNWLAGVYPLVAFAMMYFIRTPREERMMREFFGEQYVDYMRRTGRIFPRGRHPTRD